MGTTFYFQWEVDFMIWLQQFMSTGMVNLARFLTFLGSEVILVGIIIVIYWGINKKMGVFIGTNVVMALTLASQIKNLVFRRRPYFDHESIQCLSPVNSTKDLYSIEAQGYSFPSMHSANAMTVFGSIAIWCKKNWLTAMMLILTFGVGLSRICVGVHYPTDVLTGWGVGLIILIIMPWLQKKVKKKWQLYLGMLLLSLPGLFFAHTNDYYNSLGIMCGFFAGVLFEEKWVGFENTKKVGHIVLRIIIGLLVVLFLFLSLYLAFSKMIPGVTAEVKLIFRSLLLGLCVFVMIGPYTWLFKKWKILA